ncbi:hypothetical protein [Streptomyces sp. NPDC058280]|uniref:hypothetical protein n=1 Tax=Streptomyces sp. NPDC058280 TaxID=3346419 RepID=UPI0036E699E5
MTTTGTAGGTTPRRPAARQVVVSILTIDCGFDDNGRQTRQPRAKYDCNLCGQREGPVDGASAVIAFSASIRTDHPARCTARSSA